MKLLATYRGWAIEQNQHGLIIASKTDKAFPLIVNSVEHAKFAIDKREDGVK